LFLIKRNPFMDNVSQSDPVPKLPQNVDSSNFIVSIKLNISLFHPFLKSSKC
jgi:hypothetical protein